MSFGEEVKRLRIERGLTQKQLGDAIGVKQPVVAQIEAGGMVGLVGTYMKLCDALGVGCDYFRPFLDSNTPTD